MTNREAHAGQCQILALLPDIGIKLEAGTPFPGMAQLYAHLIDREMVWEFTDLVRGHLKHSMPDRVLASAAPPSTVSPSQNSPLEWLRKQWSEDATDERTMFALVELFTTLALWWWRNTRDCRKQTMECMTAAGECASALLALDATHLMTRPCLRWIMVKRIIKDDVKMLFYDQTSPQSCGANGFVDGFIFQGTVFPSAMLPVYNAPLHGFIPHWKPKPLAPGNDFAPVAGMALQAAEQLGDVELQTGCLKEMLYRGVQPPETVLSRLYGIWKANGNAEMFTVGLYRALVAQTPLSREELHRDLLQELSTGGRLVINTRLHILAALAPNPEQRLIYRDLARATDPNYVATSHDRLRDTIPNNDYFSGGYQRGTYDMMSRNWGETHGPGDITVHTLHRPSYFESPAPPPPPVASPPSHHPSQDIKKGSTLTPISPGQLHSKKSGKAVAKSNPDRREARPSERSATVEDYLTPSDLDEQTPRVARPDVQGWNGMIDHS